MEFEVGLILLSMPGKRNIQMKYLVRASVNVIIIRQEIFRLEKTVERLKSIRYNVSTLNEEITKLKIKKELFKQFIKRMFLYLSSFSESYTFTDEDFKVPTLSDLMNGYIVLGKQATHFMSLQNGVIYFIQGNSHILNAQRSVIKNK